MSVALVASIVVGAALLVAGGAKIAAGAAWPAQAVAMGAPRWTIPFTPWVEIVVGAALAAQLVRPVPAWLAVALLIAFSVVIAIRLRRGEHPPCACFGSWTSRPLGWRHLARNVALIAIAVVAAVG